MSVKPTPDYFDEAYYLRGGLYENKVLEWRPRARWVLTTFKPRRTLEIGSGEGILLDCLRQLGADACGIDLSRYGSHLFRWNRVLGSDVLLPFRGGAFDFACGFDIMEHNLEEDIPALVSELARVCSGRAFFNIALAGQTTAEENVDPTHFTLKPREWWVEKLSACFDVVGTGNCPTLTSEAAQFTLRRKNS